MQYINCYIDKKFPSKQLESQFLLQQLPGILEYHKLVTVLLFFVYTFLIILSVAHYDFTMAPIMFTLALVNLVQYIYFKIRPSSKCLIIINLYNIGIACLRLYQAFVITEKSQCSFRYNDTYFTAIGYTIMHLCLLVNPYLSTNILIMTLLFITNMAASWIIDGKLYIQGCSMLLYTVMLLWKLRVDLLIRRNFFVIKQEKSKYEHVLRVLIEQPYVIINFEKEEISFNYIESNQAAKDIDIHDSQSMRQIFRRLTIVNDKKLNNLNLERFIFDLLNENQIKKDNFFDKQLIVVSNFKVKYMIKIFSLDQDFSTFLVTIQNITQEQMNQHQCQMIMNQQIAFCNLTKEQYLFNQNLQQKPRLEKKTLVNILEKRKYELINYMNIFKTNQKINPQELNLQKILQKIKNLFPNQMILVQGDCLEILSDYSIINQLFFNFFSLVNNKFKQQVFIVKIDKFQDQTNNIAQVEICSKIQNFKRIKRAQSHIFQQIDLNNLAKIQIKGQLQYLMMKKLLQLVSPCGKFDLQQEYARGSFLLYFRLYEIQILIISKLE